MKGHVVAATVAKVNKICSLFLSTLVVNKNTKNASKFERIKLVNETDSFRRIKIPNGEFCTINF
jgi:hypothetical protein